ncbi:amidohydrolase [Terricaulis sp.]|uniref:amidohydrolase n=1 Tax=Terricaulis sp. TaxID=2768686 RepID=UPI003782E43B
MGGLNRRGFARVSLAALAAGCANIPVRGDDEWELILHGGPIYTGVESTPRVEAVRISAGRIAYLGSLEEARARSHTARVINLNGAAAFPGFVDAHCHLSGVGMAALLLDLVGTVSVAELSQRLRDYAREHRDGPIVGRGWIETHWPEGRFPTRADLDAVVADRPVFLERIDGHAAVVNSAALALAGITNATPNPEGGRIERDATGAATGMLIDNATALVERRLPQPSDSMRRAALLEGTRIYARRGWVGAHNMSTSAEEAALFTAFAADGTLPIHANLYMDPRGADQVFQRGPYADATGLVNVRGVKCYADGALGSRGAALLAPYSDAPGNGLNVTPPAELREIYARARQRRVQVTTHAIGDRGNRETIDAYEDIWRNDRGGLQRARWRIEHAQILSPQDIPRFARFGIIASMQPSHAISDLYFAPARLGPQRLVGAYAWNSLLRSGAVVCAGSDAPVEKGDPLIEFYAATYRHDLQGNAGPDWHLEEAVSRQQALAMLTAAPAFAGFQELERGTLEVGKRADVSVFSADLMTADFALFPQASAVLTIADGKITHEAL